MLKNITHGPVLPRQFVSCTSLDPRTKLLLTLGLIVVVVRLPRLSWASWLMSGLCAGWPRRMSEDLKLALSACADLKPVAFIVA